MMTEREKEIEKLAIAEQEKLKKIEKARKVKLEELEADKLKK